MTSTLRAAPRAAAGYVAPVWSAVYVYPLSTQALGEISNAHDRKLHFDVDGPGTFTFTINGRGDSAQAIQEMTTDVMVARNGIWFFRGRVGSTEDTIDPDSHKVSVTVNDYRAVIDRRYILNNPTYTNVEQASLAWTLINTTQQTNNGDLGIRQGNVPNTGVIVTRAYTFAKGVGSAITDLGRTVPGFEWEIDPNLKFNVYYPNRGSQQGLVLDYGTAVTNVDRQWNSDAYGNVVLAQGAQGVSPIVVDSQTAPLAPGGRIELSISSQDWADAATLNQQAQWAANTAKYPVASYTVQLATGVWAPNLLWVGDTVQLVIASGRLAFNDFVRVRTIDISISDDGFESVQMELARYGGSIVKRVANLDARIGKVERYTSGH